MKATIAVRFPEPPRPNRYIGWRCLHEVEGGYDSDSGGMPEIRPSENANPVVFHKDLQLVSWEMNTYNALFTKNNWRVVYGDPTAFCNGQGYGNSSDPRADWVSLRDLMKPFPKLMKAIICGGMFIRGIKIGGFLHCLPGIHAIDAKKPIPTKDEIFARNWYFVATTQLNGKVSNFPQGHGSHVYIPYALEEEVTYPIEWFTEWDEDFLPDPLKIYLT